MNISIYYNICLYIIYLYFSNINIKYNGYNNIILFFLQKHHYFAISFSNESLFRARLRILFR